jgi:hypothetical protein
MRWPAYLIFALLSIVLAVVSMFFWMVNPITGLLLFLAAPLCDSSVIIRLSKAGRRWGV